MTSSEADRFMLEHSEVAVRTYAKTNKNDPGVWRAWNDIRRYGEEVREHHAFTRESVIAGYQRIYHPIKPSLGNSDVVRRALADSAKYRRIVEKFREFRALNQPNHVPTAMGVMQEVREIMADDLSPTHCDKCKQELK